MSEGIIELLDREFVPGMSIPKPHATADFVVKGWGRRRGEMALIYQIPNHKTPGRPYEKGVTVIEWRQAYDQLPQAGAFSRVWFDRSMPACAKEGGCNFTTIGGVFVRLGLARHQHGGYLKV